MSFTGLLNKTATTTRLTITGDKEAYQAAGTFACHLQQMAPEEANFVGGVFGKTFRLFAKAGSNIQESDKITIDGTAYKVKAIKNLTYGNLAHIEAIIILPEG